MYMLPLRINGIVILVIGSELIAISLGMVSPDQLLIASSISGVLILLSFKLSKDVLTVTDHHQDSLDKQAVKDD